MSAWIVFLVLFSVFASLAAYSRGRMDEMIAGKMEEEA